jgi:alpha-tubulin suppressor-like RCC1 family protein
VLAWGYLPAYVRNAANNGNLEHIVQVSAGDKNMVALSDDGTVYTWGYYNGQGVDRSSPYPNQVVNPAGTDVLKNIVSISAGWNFTLALSADGKVYSWGWNSSGQTGRGTTDNSPPRVSPMAVQLAADQSDLSNIIAISAGYNFSLALSADGHVFAWGDNSYGQIGQNIIYGKLSRALPVMDTIGSGQLNNISMVAAGGNHALAMESAGNVLSWGYSSYGELGDGPNANGGRWYYPHKVVNTTGIGQLSGAVAIAAGYNQSLALMPDGSVLIWGQGFGGALGQGLGNTGDLRVPTAVKDMSGTGLLSLAPIATYQNWLNRGR